MDEEKNNITSGQEEPSTTSEQPQSQIIDLAAFRKGRSEKKPEHWPSAIPQGKPVEVTASATDPLERKILISSTYGDILMDGYLGLNPAFLAIGDGKGQIKFALPTGAWLAAADVTNDPAYQDGPDVA